MCKSCTSTHIIHEITLFSGKNYTVGKNFTQPPVVMVATNLRSVVDPLDMLFLSSSKTMFFIMLGTLMFWAKKYTPTKSASIFIQILQCQYIRKHGRHFSGTTRHRGDLWLEPRILNHLRVGNADHGEPGLGALHLEPPSVEVFDKVAVAECRPIPGAILSRPCVSPKQCVPLSHLG